MSGRLRAFVRIGTAALLAAVIPMAEAQTQTRPADARPASRPALPVFRAERAERRSVRPAISAGPRCRVEIEVVDQDGEPIEGARITATPEGERDRGGSIPGGQTRIDGVGLLQLPVSERPYVITASHEDYAPGRMSLTAKDAGKPCHREVALAQGASVRGQAICSDGKPAAGWQISARPLWWDSPYTTKPYDIGEDGSFTLEHIAPGEYALSIWIPVGGGGRRVNNLSNAALPPAGGRLDVKVPMPSPSSMAEISGTVEFVGGEPSGYVTVNASSPNVGSGYAQIAPGQRRFEINSLPRGVYELRFTSQECEDKVVSGVKAPTKKLKVQLQYRGKPVLKAQVVDAGSGQPVQRFYYRIRRLQTRGSSGPAPQLDWTEEGGAAGRLEVEPASRGVYEIQVWAEGFAVAAGPRMDTDSPAADPVRIAMKPGPAFSGRVVNEAGQPVSGAKIMPLSCAGGTDESTRIRFSLQAGWIESQEDGRFTITYLPAGEETLKVVHPDYVFAIVDTEIKDNQGQPPLQIVLKQGGAIEGCVFDADGKPAADASLTVSTDANSGSYGASTSMALNTDAQGRYKAEHLPEQLCFISRSSREVVPGVVRQAILPKDGRTRTLNLGGGPRITGRLLIDGKPLANGSLEIAGPSPYGEAFLAYANTDENGAFTFLGVLPGRRRLYFGRQNQQRREWTEVKRFDVADADLDLGTTGLNCAEVSVKVVDAKGAQPDGLRVSLMRDTSGLSAGGPALTATSRQNPDDPFVFDCVPPGNYEVGVYRSSSSNKIYPVMRHRIEVKPGQGEAPVTLHMPAGTASLQGRVGDGFLLPTGYAIPLMLWNPQLEMAANLRVEDRHYRIDELPAGDYWIVPSSFRSGPPLAELTLKDGENKVFDLDAPACRAAVGPAAVVGSVGIRVVSGKGLPLPEPDAYLEGPAGRLEAASSTDVAVIFYGPSGEYTLHVSYPGFRPATRELAIPHGVAYGAATASGMEIVTLEPERGTGVD
jgi:hypothetical protein